MAITLTASTGRIAGSRSSTRMRTDGFVPAVVYGLGRDSVAVSVPWPDLRRALTTEAGLNALITLDVDGQKDLAIIKALQRHPVRRNVLHVDFLRVDPDAPVAVEVPLLLIGEAKKVESRRGIVDQPLKSLTVKAKPADIPSLIEIDVTDLDIGDSITVATLILPTGVTTDIDDSIQLVLGLATRFSMEDGATESEAGEGGEATPAAAAEGDAE
ncbi:MAG: 50S ribosomal protein L25 [Acidimicrobiales bacterium]